MKEENELDITIYEEAVKLITDNAYNQGTYATYKNMLALIKMCEIKKFSEVETIKAIKNFCQSEVDSVVPIV